MANKMKLTSKMPKADKAAKAAPKAEEPKADKAAPKAEEPKAEEPKADKAAPKAAKADKAAKAAPKADKAEEPKVFPIHLNKTGRVCFSAIAGKRLLAGKPIEETELFATLKVEGKTIRIEPSKKQIEGAVAVGNGGGRPYISAMKAFKELGYDGSAGKDFEARPYGAAGFEFKYQ